MPTVPIEQNRVGIASVSGEKLQAADFGAGTEAVARGIQSLAGGIGQAADNEAAIQKIYNDTAVKTLDNEAAGRLRDILRTGPTAYYNQQGAAALEAKKPTLDAIAKVRSDLLAEAKNDYQRQVFGLAFDQRVASELDNIETHANRETLQWGIQQSTSRQQLAADSAVDVADDAALFDKNLHTGLDEVAAQGKLTGAAPEAVQLAQINFVSGVRSRIVDRKMISDPVGAAAYYQSHIDEFTSADRVKIEKALYDPLMERQASADVDGLMGSDSGAFATAPAAPAGGGSTLGRMVAITMHSESRSRDFNADGSLVRSPKGAEGRMQTMPGTQADPGFGVRPAQNDSVEEKARVGRDYLAAMVKRYNGDPAKAWAAYNAGPGRVDEAVKTNGSGWLAAMPKETRDYVSTNVAALGGNAPVYAPRRDDLNALYARIDAQPWDFERKKQARAELDKRVARDDHLQRRAEDDAKDQAFLVIDKLGDGFTSINQIPAEVRRNLSPEVLHSLRAQADQNAAPKPVAANGDTVVNLHELAALQPDQFVKEDLRKYRPYLTPGEFDELKTTQARMLAKPAERTSEEALWSALNRYGADVGLNMGAQRSGESDAAFKQRRADGWAVLRIMKAQLALMTEGRRAATPGEIKNAFDQAVVDTTVTSKGFFGDSVTTVPRYRNPDYAPTAVSVPATEKAAIRQQLARAGQPTDDATVARIYLQRQSKIK